MPKSRRRQKDDYTPQSQGVEASSGRWVVPTMCTLLLLGLAWIVIYYIFQEDIAFLRNLGGWNLLIGMGLITGGFFTATQWK